MRCDAAQAFINRGVLVMEKIGVRKTVSVVCRTVFNKFSYHVFDESSIGFYSGSNCYEYVLCAEARDIWADEPRKQGLENSWRLVYGLARELEK